MSTEPEEDRPSWLVDEEPREAVGPMVLGATEDDEKDAPPPEPPKALLERISPIAVFGASLLLGGLAAVGGALYGATTTEPLPKIPEPVEAAPVEAAAPPAPGQVQVRKGIRRNAGSQ